MTLSGRGKRMAKPKALLYNPPPPLSSIWIVYTHDTIVDGRLSITLPE